MADKTTGKMLLVIDAFRLGDLVYTGALLQTLTGLLPRSEVHLLCDSSILDTPIVDTLPVTVQTMGFPWLQASRRSVVAHVKCLWRARRRFRGMFRGVTALDPRGDVRHRAVLLAIGARPVIAYKPAEIGRDSWKGTHDHHFFVQRQMFLKQVSETFGIPGDTPLQWPWMEPRHSPPPGCRVVLIAPEASKPLKEWPAADCVALAAILRRSGWSPWLVAHRRKPEEDGSAVAFDRVWRGNARELAQLMPVVRAVVAADSFVGHLAGAMAVPVVSVFGPTQPAFSRPWGDKTRTVMAPDYLCRPCAQVVCSNRAYPCMHAVKPESVFEALCELMAA